MNNIRDVYDSGSYSVGDEVETTLPIQGSTKVFTHNKSYMCVMQ